MQEKLAYSKQEKNWELIIIVFEIGFLFISMMDQLDYSINRKTNLIQELRDKIAELERRNLDLQMKNDLLKKVRELERRGRYL